MNSLPLTAGATNTIEAAFGSVPNAANKLILFGRGTYNYDAHKSYLQMVAQFVPDYRNATTRERTGIINTTHDAVMNTGFIFLKKKNTQGDTLWGLATTKATREKVGRAIRDMFENQGEDNEVVQAPNEIPSTINQAVIPPAPAQEGSIEASNPVQHVEEPARMMVEETGSTVDADSIERPPELDIQAGHHPSIPYEVNQKNQAHLSQEYLDSLKSCDEEEPGMDVESDYESPPRELHLDEDSDEELPEASPPTINQAVIHPAQEGSIEASIPVQHVEEAARMMVEETDSKVDAAESLSPIPYEAHPPYQDHLLDEELEDMIFELDIEQGTVMNAESDIEPLPPFNQDLIESPDQDNHNSDFNDDTYWCDDAEGTRFELETGAIQY